jgi:DNA modification methylase
MSVRIIKGDVREKLAKLPADYFDCIVTSPPYYQLRNYNCEGQIGLEPTLDAYLETMVAVCRELRRVLKPSGVCFINIGDSYNSSSQFNSSAKNIYGENKDVKWAGHRAAVPGLKPKDLMLVPERLGIALQMDGWWVRSHIIWAKKNCMPESVMDRPTSAHETIWMLTKSARYYWDAEAVKEPADSFGRQHTSAIQSPKTRALQEDGAHGTGGDLSINYERETRNLRNVWHMASHPYPDAHFATFPPELAERCIKAGSPRGGQILDPFAGAGTTGLVADRLGRDCTLIDLNTEYAEMALNRIRNDCPMFAEVAAE